MKNLFLTLVFLFTVSFAFPINSVNENESTKLESIAAPEPCFVVVNSRDSNGMLTLLGSIYTGIEGCSGTVTITLMNE